MRIIQSKVEQYLYLLLLVVFIIAGVGVFFLARSNLQLSKRVDFLQGQIEHNKNITESINRSNDEINRHLDCIVVFFAQPDRENLRIEDINECRIRSEDGPGVVFPMPESTTSPRTGSQLQPADEPEKNKGRGGDNPGNPEKPEPRSFLDRIKEIWRGIF